MKVRFVITLEAAIEMIGDGQPEIKKRFHEIFSNHALAPVVPEKPLSEILGADMRVLFLDSAEITAGKHPKLEIGGWAEL